MVGKRIKDIIVQMIGGVDDTDLLYMWDCLNEAAVRFVGDTKELTAEAAITTVEDQRIYELPANFLQLHVKNLDRRLVAKYDDGSVVSEVKASEYESLWSISDPEAAATPGAFAVYRKVDSDGIVSGTVTAAGAASRGLAILTDSTADFTAAGIQPGDAVYNETDASHGVVISIPDATHISVALFTGTANQWTAEDEYTLVTQPRMVLMIDAPSLTAGHVLTVPYLRKPSPVYHDYGQWEIPAEAVPGVCALAAYQFRSRYDFNPEEDRHLMAQYDRAVLDRKNRIAAGILQRGRYPRRT